MLHRKLIKKYLPFITMKLVVAKGHNIQRTMIDGAIVCLGDLGGGVGNVVAYFPKSKEMYHFYLWHGKIRHAERYNKDWIIKRHEEYLRRSDYEKCFR